MALHHAADAVVYIEVLVPIDVPHVLPLSAIEIDRPRRTLLVARRDATDEGALGTLIGGILLALYMPIFNLGQVF